MADPDGTEHLPEPTDGDEIPADGRVVGPPPDEISLAHDVSREEFIQISHHGPLPSPQMLRQYEEAFPGLSEVIVDGYRREREHRHKMEHVQIQAQIDHEIDIRSNNHQIVKRGQNFALVIVLAAFTASTTVWIISPSASAAGAIAAILGTTLIGIVGALIKDGVTRQASEDSNTDEPTE